MGAVRSERTGPEPGHLVPTLFPYDNGGTSRSSKWCATLPAPNVSQFSQPSAGGVPLR